MTGEAMNVDVAMETDPGEALLAAAGITADPAETVNEWTPGAIRYLPLGAPPRTEDQPVEEPTRLVRARIADEPFPLVDGLPAAWEEPLGRSVPTARNAKVERSIPAADLPNSRAVLLQDVTDAAGWRALEGTRIRGELGGQRERPAGGQWDPWSPTRGRRMRLAIGAVLVDAGKRDGVSIWRVWRITPVGAPVLEETIDRQAHDAAERLAETLDRDLTVVFGAAIGRLRSRGDDEQAGKLEAAVREWHAVAGGQNRRKRRHGK